MCKDIYTYTCTCIHTHTHVYVYTHTHTYSHVYVLIGEIDNTEYLPLLLSIVFSETTFLVELVACELGNTD